jgi:hypothetical protein
LEEWNILQLAKWAGVAPWDLAAHPQWINIIGFHASVESEVAEMRAQQYVNNRR